VTPWVLDWVRAFAITLFLEECAALLLVSRFDRASGATGSDTTLDRRARWARRAIVIALVNLATHPLVWFLFPGLTMRYAYRIALSEAWAFLAEGVGYAVIWPHLTAKRAFLISLVANGLSFGVGLLL
jgi:hypothetical protein